jgi:ubiquinone/menaquinone biosynthesis C-methylase UbiE
MKETILNIYACPYCKNKLANLKCTNCGFKGEIAYDLIYLHKDDASWDKCHKEKKGWVEFAKKQGIYIDNEDHFYLPDGREHLKEFYRTAILHLNKLFEIYDFNKKKILDLGCGIGWVSRIFVQKGATVVALDCNDDRLIGLGRSTILKKHFKVEFDSLVADMENIPIIDESIDCVVMVDSLHHFNDMNEIMNEVYRILKNRGFFFAINEGFRPEGIYEKEYLDSFDLTELKVGINERRPTINEYIGKGRKLGLQVLNEKVNIDTSNGLFLKGMKKYQDSLLSKIIQKWK